ncbi:hypothetical protein E4U28_005641 [Claviceps purpurea]|nr:hypothetical protein E4U28_005641 [Claviceps purpurea]
MDVTIWDSQGMAADVQPAGVTMYTMGMNSPMQMVEVWQRQNRQAPEDLGHSLRLQNPCPWC